MEKFAISEKYRKYLIKIILNDMQYYTVWGTDLEEDADKLLVDNKRIIFFHKISTLKEQIIDYNLVFFDKRNFESWIIEESFQEPYNTTDLSSLEKFSFENLKNKEIAFEIIDSLNLIQDFYIQIKDEKKIFSSKLIVDLEDNLYNNHFWKNDGLAFPFNAVSILKIQRGLKRIYEDFVKQIEFI